MADEGEHIHMEPQSNAGKWILMVLAVLVVAGFGYASYVNHAAVQQLTAELVASQNQVRELQARMQTAEAEEETLARQAGITKKELSQRAAQLQAEQRASALRIEQYQVLLIPLPLWVVSHTHAPRWSVALGMLVNTLMCVFFQVRVGAAVTTIGQGARAFRNAG